MFNYVVIFALSFLLPLQNYGYQEILEKAALEARNASSRGFDFVMITSSTFTLVLSDLCGFTSVFTARCIIVLPSLSSGL